MRAASHAFAAPSHPNVGARVGQGSIAALPAGDRGPSLPVRSAPLGGVESSAFPGVAAFVAAANVVARCRRSSRTTAYAAKEGTKTKAKKETKTKATKAQVIDMEQARKVLSSQIPVVAKFLGVDPVLQEEFLQLESLSVEKKSELIQGKDGSDSPLSSLTHLKHIGVVQQLHSASMQISPKRHCCLLVGNTEAGLVCALGDAPSKKLAKQAAGANLLPRVRGTTVNPVEELKAVAAKTESNQCEAAAETLEALASHFDNVSMSVSQPFGVHWLASIQVSFQGKLIHGTSQGTGEFGSREEAIAAAAAAFMQLLRIQLRVSKDSPHAPSEWAELLDVESAARELSLDSLASSERRDLLMSLLGSEEEQDARTLALEAARARQDDRIAMLAEEMNGPASDGSAWQGGGDDVKARRCFHVHTPEEEDWRRDEIKGKLPAETVREDLAKALEYDQVVIVSGGTGSGKSTQFPQFILDDWTSWELEGDETVEPEVGMTVDVEYEEEWYACEVLYVSGDGATITAKYFDGGDEEPDVEVKERVRRARPRWSRQPPRVVVTQPRRIAALALAQRVSWERYGEVGGEVGHSVRGDSVHPESDTGTIEYCTVGTLLRRLINDPSLTKYNVVVVDEIHERDLMTDFLLILLREILPKRPDLRLVLMSATLDVKTFVDYLPGCHVVQVPTTTRFPVEEVHLDDSFFDGFQDIATMREQEQQAIMAFTESSRSHTWEVSEKDLGKVEVGDEGEGEEEGDETTVATLAEQIRQMCSCSEETGQAWIEHVGGDPSDPGRCVDKQTMQGRTKEELADFLSARGITPWRGDVASWEITSSCSWWGSETNDQTFVRLADQVIRRVVPDMLNQVDEEGVVGSILCFLPGWAEIKRLGSSLSSGPDGSKMWVLPLHSQVSKDDQQLVFEPAPEGQVKVILATNIAESSVTIDDVRVVVDAGLHREMTYDPKRRISFMDTVCISQSNALQRKGRAGRVRSGKVFRLYSKDHFESVPWRPAPEMQRCNLAQTCLSTIALMRDPREFLAKAPDPPAVGAVETAMAELVSIDAVRDGIPPRLLPVGQILCRMPLEPLLGRAMILGTLFGVPQTTAALMAVSGGRPPFSAEGADRKRVMEVRKEFCDWSDTVAPLRALGAYEEVLKTRGGYAASQWSARYYINSIRMRVLSRVKFQLLQDVQRSGLLDSAAADGMDPDEWVNDDEEEDNAGPMALFQEDADGAIFESEDSGLTMPNKDWLRELRDSSLEVENEKLLVGLLCAAFPTNLAMRETPKAGTHATRSATKARISRRSVNHGAGKDEAPNVPSPSWWLYGDMRMFNSEVQLVNTTLVNSWQVALFGGLRATDSSDSEGLVLDNWITVRSDSQEDLILVKRLRRELREALVWAAIAASWDRVAQAAAARAIKLFSILGAVLQGEDPDEEDVAYVKNFSLPELSPDEPALAANEEESYEELEERLFKKTVVELKVVLRELKLKVSGRKAELVERIADKLYGDEASGRSDAMQDLMGML